MIHPNRPPPQTTTLTASCSPLHLSLKDKSAQTAAELRRHPLTLEDTRFQIHILTLEAGTTLSPSLSLTTRCVRLLEHPSPGVAPAAKTSVALPHVCREMCTRVPWGNVDATPIVGAAPRQIQRATLSAPALILLIVECILTKPFTQSLSHSRSHSHSYPHRRRSSSHHHATSSPSHGRWQSPETTLDISSTSSTFSSYFFLSEQDGLYISYAEVEAALEGYPELDSEEEYEEDSTPCAWPPRCPTNFTTTTQLEFTNAYSYSSSLIHVSSHWPTFDRIARGSRLPPSALSSSSW